MNQGRILMPKEAARDFVYQPGDVRRLVDSLGPDMNDDERALLLVVLEVDEDRFSEEDRAALAELRKQVKNYDVDELSQAVDHIVTASPRKGQKLNWSGLKQRLQQWRKKRES